MSRPPVSVVVPFAGDKAHARALLARLQALSTIPGDQVIVADNSGTATGLAGTAAAGAVTIVRADGEASPSHARNAGASAAVNDWILFLDADVYAPADLLRQFFAEPPGATLGAITGDIVGAGNARTLAARYGTMRNFLGQRSHVMNPYRPRAASANLLVRRAAFTQIGGYREGIRQAEDTDFCWRLQEAGWQLGFREQAVVGHAYRATLRGLLRQWAGYAAGAAWLAREYPDFKVDPGLNRLARRLLKRVGIGSGVAFRADGRGSAASARLGRRNRLEFLIVDCLLGIAEQVGLRMSNELPGAQRSEQAGRRL
jgi:GT2 family glycosyltransferase